MSKNKTDLAAASTSKRTQRASAKKTNVAKGTKRDAKATSASKSKAFGPFVLQNDDVTKKEKLEGTDTCWRRLSSGPILKNKDNVKEFVRCAFERWGFSDACAAARGYRSGTRNPLSLEAAMRTVDMVFAVPQKTVFMAVSGGRVREMIKADVGPFDNGWSRPPASAARQLRRAGMDPARVRMLQCIPKAYNSPINALAEEYVLLMRAMTRAGALDGVEGMFCLVLTDAPLLRSDGTHPWPMVVGEGVRVCERPSPSAQYIPVLNSTGKEGHEDIPIPTYDDLAILEEPMPPAVPWKSRKGAAVFRGSSSGCGTSPKTNPRLHLHVVANRISRPDLDAGITACSRAKRFDPVRGLSSIDCRRLPPPKPFLPFEDQGRHKLMIHVEGNVAAYRLLKALRTGAVQLIVRGPYTLWFQDELKDGVNCVFLRRDLSDLAERLDWCAANDAACRRISAAGRKLASRLVRFPEMSRGFVRAMLRT